MTRWLSFTNHLTGAGHTFGVFADDRLVAYGMLGLPLAHGEDNLGRVLGLDTGPCGQVAHLASCMILPEYRGHCLQRELIAARMALAKELGRRYCVAMVSLHNGVSRNNLLAAGLAIRWVGNLGELRRQLLFSDMNRTDDFDVAQQEIVDSLDFERQCELTRRDWWGTGETCDGNRTRLVFMARHPRSKER